VAANARGIDVSNFSGNFNWAATTGLSFGICRASQGLGAPGTNSPDPFLAWNWPRIKAKGLARGAYHFLDPRLDGAAQASHFVQTVSKVGLETTDMLWLDNEAAGSSPAAVAACARAFMARLTSLRPHNPCGVYSFFNFITSGNCAGLGSYPLWLAIFQSATPTAPPPWHTWTFWQYGEASGHDNDVFNGTPAELTAWIKSFQPNVEVEVQSGQLNNGARAVNGHLGAARQRVQHRVRLRQRRAGPAARRAPGGDLRHPVARHEQRPRGLHEGPDHGPLPQPQEHRRDLGHADGRRRGHGRLRGLLGSDKGPSRRAENRRNLVIVIVSGVSGSGKTTVGALLAGRLRWRFADADDFHPAVNVEKMRAGIPLTDADRWPWLRAIAALMDERIARGEDAVLACSALKRSYRDLLLDGRPAALMVFLALDREVLARRLAARHGHFFPVQLLATQFDALEPPGPDERVLTVVPADNPAATVEKIIALVWQGHEAEA